MTAAINSTTRGNARVTINSPIILTSIAVLFHAKNIALYRADVNAIFRVMAGFTFNSLLHRKSVSLGGICFINRFAIGDSLWKPMP